ncbi:hypothetical protein F5I97DRAFT_1939548 [Phlebopus sp. FC_14]|nr:hypothetical protein F5I97DRAFT_1939548 [Phlebopus sp. FC_14]
MLSVSASRCGKYYKPGESIVTPGGNFPLPAASTDPLLAFRCAPAIRSYLAEDVSLPTGSCALTNDGTLNVTVSLDDRVLANGVVPLNATAFELSISLDGITPQMTPYGLICEASYSATNGATTNSDTTQTFSATTRLSLLPNLTNSSVTKMDLRTGALLAEIHPVPTFYNMTALDEVLDRMQEVGMYLITSDPLNATTIAYDLIYSLDGYRPVSLVLNCQDYYWPAYTAGTDIVLHDVFMVGTNVTFSNEWQTPCTPDFGDCGCDNCMSILAGDMAAVPPNTTYYAGPVPSNSGIGSYFDIRERGASFGNRLQVMGWERTKAVWTVPQGFGGEEYWVRAPTGEEWVLQSIMGINRKLSAWSSGRTQLPLISKQVPPHSQSLSKITPFLSNPSSVQTTFGARDKHALYQSDASGVAEASSNGFTLGAVGSSLHL